MGQLRDTQCDLAAGADAEYGDAAAVPAVAFAGASDPGDHVEALFLAGRVLRLRRDRVVDADHHGADLGGDVVADVVVLARGAGDEAASVDLDVDRWALCPAGEWGVRVGSVDQHSDLATPRGYPLCLGLGDRSGGEVKVLGDADHVRVEELGEPGGGPGAEGDRCLGGGSHDDSSGFDVRDGQAVAVGRAIAPSARSRPSMSSPNQASTILPARTV